jgi:hypothetical protein
MNAVERCGKIVSVWLGECSRRAIVLCFALLIVLTLTSCGEQSIEPSNDRVERRQTIQRVSLPSTVIPTAGYDADRRILEIEFRNGAVYQYSGVPNYVYQDLKNAEDPARYFNQYIRKAGYRYRQVAVGGAAAETAGLSNSHKYEQDN